MVLFDKYNPSVMIDSHDIIIDNKTFFFHSILENPRRLFE